MFDIPSDPSLLIKLPIDLEWVVDRDVALAVIDQLDGTNTRGFPFPGFGDTCYYLGMFCFENIVDVKLLIYSHGPYLKLNYDVKIYYSSNNIPGLTTEFAGDIDDKTSFPELTLFKISDEEWSNPNNGIFVNNQFSIHVKGYIVLKELDPRSMSIPEKYESRHKYRDLKKKDSDFIIAVENKEIEVHKALLQQESPVFARMFESNWKETLENRIEIPEFSYDTVKTVIDTFYNKYGGGYVKNLKKDDYFQLFQFADKYDMQIFKAALKSSIDFLPYNIVEYANLAVEFDFDEFEEWCMDYLILCLKCGYPVANINSLNDKTKNAFLQKQFIAPNIIEPFNWKHKSVNDESGIDDEKIEF